MKTIVTDYTITGRTVHFYREFNDVSGELYLIPRPICVLRLISSIHSFFTIFMCVNCSDFVFVFVLQTWNSVKDQRCDIKGKKCFIVG